LPTGKTLATREREVAAIESLMTAHAQATGGGRKSENHTAFWMAYPLTLVECALMAFVSILSYLLWRAIYCKFWYPAQARQRPNRMVKQKLDVRYALEAMQILERIGRDSGAQIFWISGTLLGLERLGQPLPHDNDLDVGIDIDDPHYLDFIRAMWTSDDVVEIAPQLISRKIQIQNPDLDVVPGCIIRFKCAVQNRANAQMPPIKTDIFLHFPYRGGVVHGSRNSLWWNTPLKTVQKAYGERTFSVPADAHLYLVENYGDYRQEVKEFENSIDCPNAMNIFSWRSLAYLLSRQQAMLRIGRIDRAKQINMRVKATILKGSYPLFLGQSSAHLGS
jgi:hypothetical protein